MWWPLNSLATAASAKLKWNERVAVNCRPFSSNRAWTLTHRRRAHQSRPAARPGDITRAAAQLLEIPWNRRPF